MTAVAGPFTRTHTIVLRGCKNKRAMLSPKSAEGRLVRMARFVTLVEKAGFTVTRSTSSRADAAGRTFGEGCGFTATAILSESHAAIHTYPEEKYNSTVEVEFNLCYLKTDHMPRVQVAKKIFAKAYKASSVRLIHSKRRYLD